MVCVCVCERVRAQSMFHAFKFPWPSAISSMFDVASMSTASVDLTAPQCTINLTYSDKWIASQALPVFLLGVLVFGIAASVLLRACQLVLVQWRRQVRSAVALGARAAVATVVSGVTTSFITGIADLTDVIIGAIFTVRGALRVRRHLRWLMFVWRTPRHRVRAHTHDTCARACTHRFCTSRT